MIFKNKKRTMLISAIFAGFFIFTNFQNAYALNYISSFTLNGGNQNATFNPNNEEKVTISINTNTPVKFNTIAICLQSDDTCSRTTAVKYFTQTSSYTNLVSKEWDGKTGGSSPVVVSEGEYKFKITMVDEINNSLIENGLYTASVNFSQTNNNSSDNESASSSQDTESDETNSSSSSETENNSSVTVKTRTVYVSVHENPSELSDYKNKEGLTISAGRERLSYVGISVTFSAEYKNGNSQNTVDFTWSFGDGLKSSGKSVSHTYKYPGEYNVILNGDSGKDHAVSRTKVLILSPQMSLRKNSDGDIEILNNGKKEINLGNWYLKAGETKFILSPDTIINSNGVIFLSSLDSKIAPNANEVILFNPSGSKVAIIQENKIESKEISKEQKGENNIENILGIRIKDAEDIIEQYKKYSVIKDDVESANEEKTIEDEEEITNNIATVGSAIISTSSEKMIIKIVKMPFTLIKAIGKVFYNF